MRARYRCELLVKKYYDIDISDYDIIKGYRADDAYFKMLQTFYEDNITLEDLSEVFELGNIGYQIALVSERAFCNLKFIDSYSVTDPSIISKRITRENLAYSNFRSIVASSVYKKKGFLSDYLD